MSTRKTILAVMLVLGVAASAAAQTLRVTTQDAADTYPTDELDSVAVEHRMSGSNIAVHTTDTVVRYGVSQVGSFAFTDVPPGDGRVIAVRAGKIVSRTALELVDSIVFVDGEIPGLDSDNDGIPDYEEVVRIGTDPRKADTDGDGWSDNVELQQFSPASDPHRFNPLVADLHQQLRAGARMELRCGRRLGRGRAEVRRVRGGPRFLHHREHHFLGQRGHERQHPCLRGGRAVCP
ncbi:MAG: hypothetical protein GF331_18005 [Chitinivibrionales bacterium]|nr:hypothetical protein [Chitinivibrionales bacterium]